MYTRNTAPRAPPRTSAGLDYSEEILAEVDEEPDELKPNQSRWSWSSPITQPGFGKMLPARYSRKESLLTRQIQSETEHTDEEHPSPPRTLSTQSTWSNPSTASTAELTSDDGHSVASPAVSPPLPPTHMRNSLLLSEKPLDQKVKIVGQEGVLHSPEKPIDMEKTVEANLGRKRCISFACKSKPDSKPAPAPVVEPPKATSPPKRKCMLKFVCPTRTDAEGKPVEKSKVKRPVSPPPPERRTAPSLKHRGSDSTVTQTSPKYARKTPAIPTPEAPPAGVVTAPTLERKYSNDSDEEDEGSEAMRFHEFATDDTAPEEWVKEATCHRSRLTVNDTLEKENVIRKTCEEVEEEALEEEQEEEEDELEEELAAVAESDGEMESEVDEDEDESDDGFHSDDEDGFANSDSENDSDSDFEWWKPSGLSTAATSVDQLDRLAIVNSKQPVPSSVGSASSGHLSAISSQRNFRKSGKKNNPTPAVTINKPEPIDLPDSTDFVCGTLDEDRPLEQAYLNRIKSKEAAKRPVRPQDIDPTFPTSDPEMDEEDNDDVDEVASSHEDDDFMHGNLDEIHGAGTAKRRPSPRPTRRRATSNAHYSPPPANVRHHSPPPSTRRISCRSPPPPPKRTIARSPAPRKLFGHSPIRMKSPAPVRKMTSPPNSPTECNVQQLSVARQGLAAGRPQLTHTSSLPRGGPITLSKLATVVHDDEDTDDVGLNTEVPKRGAIDIVKGLEKKRQRRKERLYQKLCAKAAAKGEKPLKIKPGKGAERMREVGLQLQQYHGKAEHILSL